MEQVALDELRNKMEEWVSGEYLSELQGVSRTAVWKQIKALREEGYEIESSPRKGYRLCRIPDLLLPAELAAGLTTRVFGREHYFYYKETDSTNSRARELALQGYPEGTVAAAEAQTAGRGRRGRNWVSTAGEGIYASLILRPSIPVNQLNRVPIMAAAAVADAVIGDLGLPAGIKWPNDILVNSRKIAGILIEASTDMDSVEFVVVGIGLNVNNPPQSFSGELGETVTSARLESGRSYSRVRVLQSLLLRLEEYYATMSGDFTPTLSRVKELSLLEGAVVQVDGLNSRLTGRAFDIDDNGFLMVVDEAGTIHTITSGDVTVVKQPGYR